MGMPAPGRPIINRDIRLKRLYGIYNAMIARCSSPSDKGWANYGGRGIKVCPRWLESFWNFYDDMGLRPDGMVLDRIDNDQGYSPENCRWADYKVSASNRRYCIYMDDGGERVTLKEYCRRHGLIYRAITKRVRKGEPPENAVLRAVKKTAKPITERQAFAIRAMHAYGLDVVVICKRLGMSRTVVGRVVRRNSFRSLDVARIRAEIRAQWGH